MTRAIVGTALAILLAGAAGAQTPGTEEDGAQLTRFSRAVKSRYDTIKRDIVEAAEAMPESEYAFRATSEVRTFGQIIGHIADSQNFFCDLAAGNNPDYTDTVEKSMSTKADLVNALKASMDRCDRVYADAEAAGVLRPVKAGRGDALRGMVLIDNVSHDNEHYGNLVTYMRLKGHIPPSTLREQKGR
jgi:uncharacterized damage-inducible protein DinB